MIADDVGSSPTQSTYFHVIPLLSTTTMLCDVKVLQLASGSQDL
jgi:hypothetical protein